jgi:peptidyl-prolyl cis-trans isomerase C
MRAPRFLLTLPLVAVLTPGTLGCGSTNRPYAGASAVATVNGESLSTTAFDRFVSVKLGEFAAEPLNDSVRSQLLDEFVKREVAVQAAVERGLAAPQPIRTADEEAEKVLAEQAIDSLVDRYYSEVVLKDVRVTPEEVARYYDAHRDAYKGATGYYVREILVRSREEAERARQSVAAGCDFGEVAREVSTAPTAARGGLSFYDARSLPSEFSRVITRLGAGETSDVVRSELGYHIFRLERRSGGESLDRVRERVADDLRADKNGRLVEADMERLLAESEVEINRDHLQFQYEGRFVR